MEQLCEVDVALIVTDHDDVDYDLLAKSGVLVIDTRNVMRRAGIEKPYEKLKALTRGQAVTQALLHEFIASLEIPEAEKARLLELTPESYTGLAADLAGRI